MIDDVKNELDKYLEFDSDCLFDNGELRIFGGAIRDIICGDKINDVDILCDSYVEKKINIILESNGYNFFDGLVPKDLMSIYKNGIISEPHTWIKGLKIVQIIRPRLLTHQNGKMFEMDINNVVRNVDISCCAVSYNGKDITEHNPNAILHCIEKVFIINYTSKMYSSERIQHRRHKLEDRGWKLIDNNKETNRNIKIEYLEKMLE